MPLDSTHHGNNDTLEALACQGGQLKIQLTLNIELLIHNNKLPAAPPTACLQQARQSPLEANTHITKEDNGQQLAVVVALVDIVLLANSQALHKASTSMPKHL